MYRLKALLRLSLDRVVLFLSESSYGDRHFTLVSGANSSHFLSLMQWLESVSLFESHAKVYVYDLGLRSEEKGLLKARFDKVILRAFDYSAYPEFFDINLDAGQYAWKSAIIWDVLSENDGIVCWMDAGNVLTSHLRLLRRATEVYGLYSPISRGTIADWTHPETLNALNAPRSILPMRNLNGACIAVDAGNAFVMELINHWRVACSDKDIIAPLGSGRHNHRQDQAVLSVIVHKAGLGSKLPSSLLGFKIHQDVDAS